MNIYKEYVLRVIKREIVYKLWGTKLHHKYSIDLNNINFGIPIENSKKYLLGSILGMELIGINKPKVVESLKDLRGKGKFKIISINLIINKNNKNDIIKNILKLNYEVLPKIQPFSGLSKKGFDNSGRLTINLHSILLFPELDHYQKEYQLKIIGNIKSIESVFIPLKLSFSVYKDWGIENNKVILANKLWLSIVFPFKN